MKQLHRLLLLLSAVGGLFASCSPRAYLGSRAAPAVAEARPVFTSASIAVPLAAQAGTEANSTNAAPAPVQAIPSAQPVLAEVVGTAHKAWVKPNKILATNTLPQPAPRRRRPHPTEVAGTPTGLEGLGDALLKIALLLFVLFALLGIVLMLLVKLIVHLLQKRKRPGP